MAQWPGQAWEREAKRQEHEWVKAEWYGYAGACLCTGNSSATYQQFLEP